MRRYLTAALLAAAICFAASPSNAEIVLLFEDFEDTTVDYTLSNAESSDGTGDFFGRVPDISFGTFVEYGNIQGSGYFAAMDIDASGQVGDPEIPDGNATITWSGIDISGAPLLQFSGFFAEDDDGTSEDWDADTSLIVQVQIDNGGFVDVLSFQAEEPGGDTTNNRPLLDTDFDGVGDGAELTSSFSEFTAAIAGTGNTLDLRLQLTAFDAGDEDIAFDNITISAIPEPTSAIALAVLGTGVLVRRRRR